MITKIRSTLMSALRWIASPFYMTTVDKKAIVLQMLQGPNGARRVAYSAKKPFMLDPVRTAADLKKLCPAEHLPAVLQYLYVEVHEAYNEPAFWSYFK